MLRESGASSNPSARVSGTASSPLDVRWLLDRPVKPGDDSPEEVRIAVAMPVSFEVNGKQVSVEVEPRMTLADCLRHVLRLTGTHVGCEHGVCGACTILVDGAAVRACLLLAVQAEGHKVVTI